MIKENLNPEQLRCLVRAEVALDTLNEWAGKLQDGSEEVLRIVDEKITELSKKIKLMRMKSCTHCGAKSYLKDDECPYCGITN